MEIRTVKTLAERVVGRLRFKKRFDRLEKSAHLVPEHGSKAEELYSAAERHCRGYPQTAQHDHRAPNPFARGTPGNVSRSVRRSRRSCKAGPGGFDVSWCAVGPALLSCVRRENQIRPAVHKTQWLINGAREWGTSSLGWSSGLGCKV